MKRSLHPLLALAPLLLLPAAAGAGAGVELESPLDGHYDLWLRSVSHLASAAEREAFLNLGSDVHREIFIRRFWQARAQAGAGGPRGAAPLTRWRESFEEARRRFGSLDEDRARALMTAGKPGRVTALQGCREVIRFLEIWSYEPWHAAFQTGRPEAGGGFHLLFYRDSNLDGGTYRRWSRRDGTAPLMYGPDREPRPATELADFAAAGGCFDRPGDRSTFEAALAGALDAAELRQRLVPEPPDPAWLDGLRESLASGTERPLPAAPAEIRFPGRYQRKTIVHGRILVPASEVRRNAEGLLFGRLVIQGDLRLAARGRPPGGRSPAGRLVDVFEVVHHIAGAQPEGGAVPLEFYRRLRPGTYTLELRAEDADGLGLLRETRTLEVPALEREAVPPAGRWSGFAALTRSEVGVLSTFPGVELLPPADGLPVGEIEIVAVATGGPIERVDFLLDGEAAGSDHDPPYAAELRLGTEPRTRAVTAVAFDPSGRELARDELALDATGSRRFAVHLIEPVRGSPVHGQASGRARAVVEVPPEETLDRVELYLGDRRLATLREPPFSHPLPAIGPSRVRPTGVPGAVYVRAVAVLASGESAEDVVVLTPSPLERIDVHLVELYTTVLDRQGRPVTGLGREMFRVLEDGTEQQVQRFGTVEKLAINVALLMDVSGSMRGRVKMATRSAQRFFETVMTAKDLASLQIFNHDIRRVVPFTDDVERLRYGADGFRAFGTTRLHDGLIYTVHSFGGRRGKRALVLLSDGQDVDSDFQFKQVRESTLRSGVAVYPIMLDLEDEETRSNLVELAVDSGGTYFSIRGVGELDRVYRRIEQELRSQYLLVYEPPPRAAAGGFRRVEVEVLGEGLKARTIGGYYP